MIFVSEAITDAKKWTKDVTNNSMAAKQLQQKYEQYLANNFLRATARTLDIINQRQNKRYKINAKQTLLHQTTENIYRYFGLFKEQGQYETVIFNLKELFKLFSEPHSKEQRLEIANKIAKDISNDLNLTEYCEQLYQTGKVTLSVTLTDDDLKYVQNIIYDNKLIQALNQQYNNLIEVKLIDHQLNLPVEHIHENLIVVKALSGQINIIKLPQYLSYDALIKDFQTKGIGVIDPNNEGLIDNITNEMQVQNQKLNDNAWTSEIDYPHQTMHVYFNRKLVYQFNFDLMLYTYQPHHAMKHLALDFSKLINISDAEFNRINQRNN